MIICIKVNVDPKNQIAPMVVRLAVATFVNQEVKLSTP